MSMSARTTETNETEDLDCYEDFSFSVYKQVFCVVLTSAAVCAAMVFAIS